MLELERIAKGRKEITPSPWAVNLKTPEELRNSKQGDPITADGMARLVDVGAGPDSSPSEADGGPSVHRGRSTRNAGESKGLAETRCAGALGGPESTSQKGLAYNCGTGS